MKHRIRFEKLKLEEDCGSPLILEPMNDTDWFIANQFTKRFFKKYYHNYKLCENKVRKLLGIKIYNHSRIKMKRRKTL